MNDVLFTESSPARQKQLRAMIPVSGHPIRNKLSALKALNSGSSVLVMDKNRSVRREYVLNNRASKNNHTSTISRNFGPKGDMTPARTSRAQFTVDVANAIRRGHSVIHIGQQGFKRGKGLPVV